MMKIAICSPFNPSVFKERLTEPNIPDINGNATSANLYVKGLLELGHEITVYTSASISDSSMWLYGDKLTVCIVSNIHKRRGFSKIQTSNKIKQEIEKHVNDYDYIHAQWTYEYAYSVIGFEKTRVVLCSVRDWCPYLLEISKGIKNKIYWLMNYFVFLRVMKTEGFHFIANSLYTYNRIHESYPNKNVVIIPNPLDKDKVVLNRHKYPITPIYVSISQYLDDPRKNYSTLLKAFKIVRRKIPESKLIIIGKFSHNWKKHQNDDGLLENVTLKGKLPHSEIFNILDNSTCLVHPALEETFGNILLEAMSRQVICVGGKNAGAIPQVLGNGKYGILCDELNYDDMAEKMIEAIDPICSKNIINAASKELLNTYAETVIAQKHIDYVSTLMNG